MPGEKPGFFMRTRGCMGGVVVRRPDGLVGRRLWPGSEKLFF